MLKAHTTFASIILVTLWFANALAQGDNAKSGRPDDATVTAFASGDRVRFTAPSSVVQIRLEVYDSVGKKLFDNEVRVGNVLDWHLQNGQAEPLADDGYLCVVTVKSVSGKLTQRIGSVTIEKKTASLQPLDVSQITAQQSQAVGPVEENASLVVLKEDDNQTTTVIAHNGEEGQITRGRGALSFRIGDFYTGKDTEQMRLTSEGNLGIGITHPLVKLDVDGLVRASQGIIFPDGSVQYSAATKTYGAKSSLPGGSLQSKSKNSSGGQEHIEAVSQNVIPKADSGGNLVDTLAPIYETVAGNVGIGTTTPDPYKLNVNGALNVGGSNLYLGGNLRFTDNGAAGYTNFVALNGNLTNFDGVNYEQLNLYNPSGDKAIHLAQTAAGSQISSIGAGNTTLTLQPSGGNVGIGATAPVFKLQVFDSSNTGLRVGTNTAGGTVASFGGRGAFQIDAGFGRSTIQGGRLTITESGLVGIGTTSPADVLDVVGVGTAIRATDGSVSTRFFSSNTQGKGYVGTLSPHPFVLRTGDVDRITIDTAGNVGVAGNLTVGGTLSASGLEIPATSNLLNLGLLRWDRLRQTSFTTGPAVFKTPNGVAFDGTNMWFALSLNANNVIKLRASDGACITGNCRFTTSGVPGGLAFDGANIWIANPDNATVTRLRASDGACVGTCTFPAGPSPTGIAFDGANIWVTNNMNPGIVTRLRASDGACVGTCTFSTIGANPVGIAFDGSLVWITNTSGIVARLRASDGVCSAPCQVPSGGEAFGVAFDGTSIWVTNTDNGTLAKFRAIDGANLGFFNIGATQGEGISFDGTNIWVADGAGSLIKVRPADGTVLATIPTGGSTVGVGFDGANIWAMAGVLFNPSAIKIPTFP